MSVAEQKGTKKKGGTIKKRAKGKGKDVRRAVRIQKISLKRAKRKAEESEGGTVCLCMYMASE